MAICVQCNQEGGEGKFCVNCGGPMAGQRLCPRCGGAMELKFCPECGFYFSEETAASAPQPSGGFKAGDIGLFKGNIDNSTHIAYEGAKAGSIIIGIPPQENAHPQAVCPICGRYAEKRDSFRCLRCTRDWICTGHRDPELNCCQDCAAVEKSRREVEALRAEKLRLEQENLKTKAEQETRKDPERPPEIQAPPTPPRHPVPAQIIGTGTVKTSLSEKELAGIMEELLQAYGAKNVQHDPVARTVLGKTGMNLQTVGQIITATLQPLQDGCSVTITSRPKVRQLLDSGRSSSDVQKLTDLLLRRLNARY